MSIKRWTDPVTGERHVEQNISLGLGHLKWLPALVALIGLSVVLELIIVVQLGLMYQGLDIVIKKHLYIVTYGAMEQPERK